MIINLIFLFLTIQILFLALQIRNIKVLKYRKDLILKAGILDLNDIQDGKIPWRLDEIGKVDFDEMLYKFWRPLDSFYRGTRIEGLEQLKIQELPR